MEQEHGPGPDQELDPQNEVGTGTALEVVSEEERAIQLAEARNEIRSAANLSIEEWPDARLKAIASTVCPPGTSAQHMAMFLTVAEKYQLDPFMGEIWLVKEDGHPARGDKAAKPDKYFVMTGRDSYLAIAERDEAYEGFNAGVVYEHDTFDVEKDGDTVKVTHLISGFDRGQRVGAYCVAYRKGRRPMLVVRPFSQYQSLQAKKNWKNNPDDMLETRVITVAHRYQYRITGLYTQEEFADNDFDGEGGMKPVDELAAGIEGTKTRIEALKQQHAAKEAACTGQPAKGPVTDFNVLACKVEFGKYLKRQLTWGQAFEEDPKTIVGYVRHYVLQDSEHESLTKAVRAKLVQAVDAHEEAQSDAADVEEADQRGEDAQAGDTPEDVQGSADGPLGPSDGKESSVTVLYAEAQGIAADLAALGALSHEDATEIDLLLHDEDTDGMARLRNKLSGILREKVDQGADPGLGI
jgi:phage recombination protein Bet